MDSKTVKKKPVSAAPMPITAVSQAAYEGSIPFARSNYSNDLAHRRVLAPGKIPSTVRTAFSTFSRVALYILAEQRILFSPSVS